MSPQPLLTIDRVTKSFAPGSRAVDEVTLSVDRGQSVVLVGPSGCGKTTLLRLIAGLDAPTSGSIAIDGRDARKVPPRQRRVAMVFQNHVLFPHLSLYDNLAFGLRLRGQTKAEIQSRVTEVAETLRIAPLLRRKPHEVSGGERQRAALGRAMVGQPALFLFDEPFSNLDAWLKAELRDEIARMHAISSAAMFLVSHDPADALQPGRRVLSMRNGRVEEVAEPSSLFASLAPLSR